MITKTSRLILVGLLMLGLSAGPAPAQRKKQIAIFDFDFTTVDEGLANRVYGGQKNLAQQVTASLISRLFGLGTYQVVERSKLDIIRKEQNLLGVDDGTAAKAGKLAGADLVVVGSVTVFDLQGQRTQNDKNWDPRGLKATIRINFRAINTTSAVVKLSSEQSGVSNKPPDLTTVLTERLCPFCPKPDKEKEAIKEVVRQAVEDVIGKISADLDKPDTSPPLPPGSTVSGTVLAVQGPKLVVAGISKTAASIGMRLEVRRVVPAPGPDGKPICYTDKIGMAEITEIQDQVVIASFLDTEKVQKGDLVASPGAQLPPPKCPPDGFVTPLPPSPPPPTVRQVQVQANRNWNDTGIDVQPGKQLAIEATGIIKISPTREVVPVGLTNRPALPPSPLPGANIGALIARICSTDGQCSPVLIIGAQKQFNPNKAGRLMLGVNDSDVADNSGSFTVTARW